VRRLASHANHCVRLGRPPMCSAPQAPAKTGCAIGIVQTRSCTVNRLPPNMTAAKRIAVELDPIAARLSMRRPGAVAGLAGRSSSFALQATTRSWIARSFALPRQLETSIACTSPKPKGGVTVSSRTGTRIPLPLVRAGSSRTNSPYAPTEPRLQQTTTQPASFKAFSILARHSSPLGRPWSYQRVSPCCMSARTSRATLGSSSRLYDTITCFIAAPLIVA
jgi:hypothetical protein